MAARKATDDEIKAALTGRTVAEAAQILGLHERNVYTHKARLARQGWSPEHGLNTEYPDGYKMGKVTIQRNADGEIVNTWERMCEDSERQMQMMRSAIETLCNRVPAVPSKKAVGSFDEKLCVGYPIGDPHFGEYIWGAEAGGDWDLAIARQTHIDAMAALVEGAPRAERGLIVNLGDALHYDSLMPKTPRSGHILNSDGRFSKMVDVLIDTMVTMIEMGLDRHKTLHVINVQGNHDETGSQWLSRVLAARFINEPRITFDLTPSVFNYYRFGKVLVGSHHGHSAKPAALPGVMAADRPIDWGETVHRYWWTGHIHHESKKEFPGVSVESFNTVAPADPYAYNAGYRSRQTMKSIVLHCENGEVSRQTVHPDMVKGVAA